MADRRQEPSSRLADVMRRLQEAKTRQPRGTDASWSGPVSDSGAPPADPAAPGAPGAPAPEAGEIFWRPFNPATPKALERSRPFRTAPPSRDEFESHLSQFLGSHKRTGPLFRVQGLTVRFGSILAVSDVDLEINDGEVVAVVGPNGAGKTAMCDALSGFIARESGRIYFGDRDVSLLPAHRRAALGLARGFEVTALFESMTVVENLMTARHGKMRGGFFSCGLGLALSKHEDRVARAHALEMLELLGLEQLADRPVAGLPAGARRLTELGRALCAEPKLAILDEPAAGLDQKERRELSERIAMVCDEMGVAVLLTDQDTPFVASLADYVYVMDLGSVVGKGEPGQFEAEPRVQKAFLRPRAAESPPP